MINNCKTAYLDCFSGASGDMLLGALIHAGVNESHLKDELAKLKLPGVTLTTSKAMQAGIGCLKVDISSKQEQKLRTLPIITDTLENSTLKTEIISKALNIFTLLAQAEAEVHEMELDKIHFHEVGAIDTIIDIVGVLICFDLLGVTKIISSPLPLGRGFVNCDHGKLPLPAPAVCNLLKGCPTYGVNIEKELVTPTGAAIIKGCCQSFGNVPQMTTRQIGYGSGSHTLAGNQPNLLRILIGEEIITDQKQRVLVIETNLDDWSPETFPYLCDKLLREGALDVNITAIQMKKGRPGFKLQIICDEPHKEKLSNTVLTETTAIGLRYRVEQRITLPRETIEVPTPWGSIKAKKVMNGNTYSIYPEYEECKKIAEQHHVPIQQIYQSIQREGGEK